MQPAQIAKIKSDLAGKSRDQLIFIKNNGVDNASPPAYNMGIVASIMIEEMDALTKQAAERRQWWKRPPGLLAIGIITNLLTAAVFYLLGRQG